LIIIYNLSRATLVRVSMPVDVVEGIVDVAGQEACDDKGVRADADLDRRAAAGRCARIS
jgi:hypothetical protein